MASPSNLPRDPVYIEYDKWDRRVVKRFHSPYDARRFYLEKDRLGRNPKVVKRVDPNPDWWRGGDSEVTVFDVIQAMHIGHVDRLTILRMFELMNIPCIEGMDNLSDAQLICLAVFESDTEDDFSRYFKAACAVE